MRFADRTTLRPALLPENAALLTTFRPGPLRNILFFLSLRALFISQNNAKPKNLVVQPTFRS
jgi:hypothetical protein